MPEWSGLLQPARKAEAQGGEGAPPAKRQDTDTSASDQKLLRQLESRVRTLEFENQITKFFNNDAPIISNMVGIQKHYDSKVKEIGGGHTLGSPHLHLFGSVLSDIESFFTKGASPDLQGYQFLAERLKMHIEVSKDPISIEEWCKVCGFSKTYDGKKTRLTLDLRGQVVIGSNPETTLQLFQKAKDAYDLGEIHTHPFNVVFPAELQARNIEPRTGDHHKGMGADGKQRKRETQSERSARSE